MLVLEQQTQNVEGISIYKEDQIRPLNRVHTSTSPCMQIIIIHWASFVICTYTVLVSVLAEVSRVPAQLNSAEIFW